MTNVHIDDKLSKGGSNVMLYLLLLAIQFGIQPILSRTFSQEVVFNVSTVWFCEIMKGVLACMTMMWNGEIKSLKKWSFRKELFSLSFLAATLYGIQNLLLQLAYQNLDPIVFNLLNQSKIIWCAFFLYMFLDKYQSFQQKIALGLMMLSSVMLAYRDTKSAVNNSFLYGIIPVITASIISGLASAVSEKILQNKTAPLYSFELSIFAVIQLPIMFMLTNQYSLVAEKGIFAGWSIYTLIPIMTNAAGGIIVGQVTKQAGSVNKGFALIIGVILSGIFQFLIFGIQLTWTTLVAIPLVFTAIHLHSKYPYPRTTPPNTPKKTN